MEATRKKQTQMWLDLILNYCRRHKISEIDVIDAANHSPLFRNDKINRTVFESRRNGKWRTIKRFSTLLSDAAHLLSGRLSLENIRFFLNELVLQGFGEWLDKDRNRLVLWWRKPEDWALIIYKWVRSCRHVTFNKEHRPPSPENREIKSNLFSHRELEK